MAGYFFLVFETKTVLSNLTVNAFEENLIYRDNCLRICYVRREFCQVPRGFTQRCRGEYMPLFLPRFPVTLSFSDITISLTLTQKLWTCGYVKLGISFVSLRNNIP